MFHIIINENETFSKCFKLKKAPVEQDLLRFTMDDELTQIFIIVKVEAPPLGLSGKFHYQVTLERQTRRRGDQTLVPLIKVEEYTN